MRRSPLVALVAACILMGCGYSLVGRGTNLPESVRSVHLQPLENLTARSQVEQILARAIANELVTRQRFTLASEAAQADAELAGAVVGFAVNPVTFDSEGRATEYEIAITARMSFRQLDPEKVLWANDRYLFKDSYTVEASEASFFDRETVAIEQVAQKFAQTIVTDLLEGF